MNAFNNCLNCCRALYHKWFMDNHQSVLLISLTSAMYLFRAKDDYLFKRSWQENLLHATTLQRTLKSMTIYKPKAGN